jgi:hypothetical protein
MIAGLVNAGLDSPASSTMTPIIPLEPDLSLKLLACISLPLADMKIRVSESGPLSCSDAAEAAH